MGSTVDVPLWVKVLIVLIMVGGPVYFLIWSGVVDAEYKSMMRKRLIYVVVVGVPLYFVIKAGVRMGWGTPFLFGVGVIYALITWKVFGTFDPGSVSALTPEQSERLRRKVTGVVKRIRIGRRSPP